MRLISFRKGGVPGVGVMTDESRFIDLADVASDLPKTLRAVLETDNGLDTARSAAAGAEPSLSLDDVTLDPVIPEPQAIWALALNFHMHLEETRLTTSDTFPQIFIRTPASQVGHLQPLLCPDPEVGKPFDYEGELAVIIGRGGRHIPVDKALDHVAGYSCYNEGSIREFQQHNRQFGLGKNFEQSGSFGPWMLTADEFGDPADHTLITRLNGVEKQHTSLQDMIFSVGEVIHYLSTGYALRRGDVIVMGTPGAIPPPADWQPGPNDSKRVRGRTHMVPGDIVEVEISGLGTLKNSIVGDVGGAYQPE